jgi:hypothetical protein
MANVGVEVSLLRCDGSTPAPEGESMTEQNGASLALQRRRTQPAHLAAAEGNNGFDISKL